MKPTNESEPVTAEVPGWFLLMVQIQRVSALTRLDLQNKTVFELMTSAVEEIGEFARELKIESGTFGNQHKAPDEGTQAEAVDLCICALALYFARGGTLQGLEPLMQKKLDKWEKNQGQAGGGPDKPAEGPPAGEGGDLRLSTNDEWRQYFLRFRWALRDALMRQGQLTNPGTPNEELIQRVLMIGQPETEE